MKRAMLVLLPGLALAGCASGGSAPRPARAAPVPIPTGTFGLEGVIGQNARGLVARFGTPTADLMEGNARKLQFSSATCVLDAYLYPKGSAEPVVTYLDTRQGDGSPVDRASCVSALAMRARNGK
ncbi:hypothetical protein [Sphingomonas sp. Leaf357]|uniref:hypothetical protein n=1 Tax=Sphingomonas sp. Leaf357 TaxID=1736350 RepID=UPI002E81BAB2|nr:hypothetical protein [Sphingomonas sp. Leaf357]